MTIYFIPGPENLGGKMFLTGSRTPVSPLGGSFRTALLDHGIETKTIDAWSEEAHKKEDVLFVWGVHPEETAIRSFLFWCRSLITGRKRFAVDKREFHRLLGIFSKKILYQIEVPINTPYPFRRLKRLSKIYDKILLFLKEKEFSGPNIGYLMAPIALREDFPEFHATPKNKFLVMINSNLRPRGFRSKEQYSERLRAVRFFSQRADFDLYGTRWDRVPFFPHWRCYFDAKRSWRGTIPGDKFSIMAGYKFAICFENSKFNGYVSEKIFDCLMAGVVPVYLGAPDITDYVPADCFIDMRKFKSYSELEDYLRAMSEANRKKYLENIARYLNKERDGLFSPRVLAEKIIKAVSD
ncbi:MAG TPA: glycosyltransferase family 10 [Candidatus Paceibacterota bacterium]|nr:glycosyltransferase family 10 [Candidatus Paceibacterota bacterium]